MPEKPAPDSDRPASLPSSDAVVELNLSEEALRTPVDWSAAFAELEKQTTPKPKPAPAPAKPATPPAAAAPSPASIAPPTDPGLRCSSPDAIARVIANPSPRPAPPPVAGPTPTTVGPTSDDLRPKTGMARYEELIKKPSMKMESEDLKILDELSDVMSHVNGALNGIQKFAQKHPYLMAPNVRGAVEDNLKEANIVLTREFHNLRNGRLKKVYEKKFVCTKCHTVFLSPLQEGVCDECRTRPEDKNAGWY